MAKTVTSISITDQMDNEFLQMTPEKTIQGDRLGVIELIRDSRNKEN